MHRWMLGTHAHNHSIGQPSRCGFWSQAVDHRQVFEYGLNSSTSKLNMNRKFVKQSNFIGSFHIYVMRSRFQIREESNKNFLCSAKLYMLVSIRQFIRVFLIEGMKLSFRCLSAYCLRERWYT